MGLQFELPMDSGKKKILIYAKADDCVISRFNTRKTRNEDDITQLAQRIERNGFEITRALWAYSENGKYDVFAGGNRLEAVRKTSYKDNVPLWLHEGFSFEEIASLESIDNENDEYHVKVSIVDVWAEYARLRDKEGWAQERIARAKGVSQGAVSKRLKYHDKLPGAIKENIRQEKLSEDHLEKITSLFVAEYFSPWLTTEQLWLSLANLAIKQKLSVAKLKEEVDRWKEIIKIVENYYDSSPDKGIERKYEVDEEGNEICIETKYNPQDDFVKRLAEKQPDTKRKVENIIHQIERENLDTIKNHEAFLARQQDELAKERQKREAEELRRKEREFFYPRIFCQSSENMDGELIDIDGNKHTILDNSVHLVVTSPPYNAGKKYDVYDDNLNWEDYQALLRKVFAQCYKKLVVGGRIAVNIPKIILLPDVGKKYLVIEIPEILKEVGFMVRCLITWVKTLGKEGEDEDMSIAISASSTAWGSWKSPSDPALRPQTEFIWVCEKGSSVLKSDVEPDITEDEFKKWTRDVWFIPSVSDPEHPAVFPEELAKRLIKLYSYPEQTVLDPFMGTGRTGVVAINRRFIGFDISETYCRIAINRINEQKHLS